MRPSGSPDYPVARRWPMLACMTRPDAFTRYLLDELAPIGPVSARRMFGGVGLFHGDTMFGLIARDELYFKVGEPNWPDYEAAGQAPFAYDTKGGRHTLTSYWSCPSEALDDPDALRGWARKAVAVALAAKQTSRKRPAASVRRG